MQDGEIGIIEILEHINPALCSYQEWVNVGMALKEEGYTVSVWDEWSKNDCRYHNGECERKWKTFQGNQNPVTAGTIFQIAKDQGWKPSFEGSELDWDSEIGKDRVIDKSWVESRELNIPEHWNPVKQLITYLETLFDSTENVGYVTTTWEKDGKYLPTKGNYDRTAGELIQALNNCKGDIGSVLGDYREEAGAWIRFNPLDGEGVKNDNVTDFRFALVESDNMELEMQNALLHELELPIAALVYSGGKSLHAIVRIDAADYSEYRKRVDYLYAKCQKNGLTIDSQNKNPSRLSRMPGVTRKGQKQYLLETNIGKQSWAEWQEWIEGVDDDLPDPEKLENVWDNLPELAPPLIDGILRQGHKMLVAGPSKAGKSFALIELCCAIAEGKKWLGFDCTQGKVMYVNLELDRASCLHRFKDVYNSLYWEPENISNIDIWNLRGKSIPMDKLAPKMIRRAAKKNYIAIIIDPIYKIITGDENSAEQMSKFCNQFDKVCTELGCAVIYCHHHSKGLQGEKKSMDRASGSGVFARDPDALIDLIELDLDEAIKKQLDNKAVCEVVSDWLSRFNMKEHVAVDDLLVADKATEAARGLLKPTSFKLMMKDINSVKQRQESFTAWRIEETLREYPKFNPINLWFKYPVHVIDDSDILKDIDTQNSKGSPWQKNFNKRKSKQENKKDRQVSLEGAFEYCNNDGKSSLKDLSEYLGKSEKTVRNYVEEHTDFWIKDGVVGKIE